MAQRNTVSISDSPSLAMQYNKRWAVMGHHACTLYFYPFSYKFMTMKGMLLPTKMTQIFFLISYVKLKDVLFV